MRGLTSLTEPDEDDPVGAIVDVAVIGARGDGKTQLIVHAIRTLRAYAPLLEGAEHQYNRDVLQVVMSAREPRPEATAPGVVPHYVFRIRPDSLLSQVGLGGRLALYASVAGLLGYVLLAILNAGLVGGLLWWLRGGVDAAVIGVPCGLLVAGIALGAVFARRRFIRRGDMEIVFWDVAGEHVYSSSAADYYSFLSALVRKRRQGASRARSYAFAPVLICNPIALGTRVEGSPYSRLRQLIPLFASLNEPLPRALVAINRWAVVEQVCAPDTDREQILAVVPTARAAPGEEDPDDATEPAGEGDGGDVELRRLPLPAVQRDVVRRLCMDAEDGKDNEVHFSYLRYDAGIQCEFHEQTWSQWHSQDSDDEQAEARNSRSRSRWRAPSIGNPDLVLDYIYEDGPGSFTGDVRRTFLNWLAALAYHEASYGPAKASPARAVRTSRADEQLDEHAEAAFVAGPQRAGTDEAAASGRADLPGEPRDERDSHDDRDERDPRDVRAAAAAGSADESHRPWRPRPLSAHGLEEFARGAIASALSPAEPGAGNGADHAGHDKPTPRLIITDDDDDDDENDDVGERFATSSSDFVREDTEPGIGPSNPSSRMRAQTPATRDEIQPVADEVPPAADEVASGDERDRPDGQPPGRDEPAGKAGAAARGKRSGDTLPMGGFGSGGT